MEDILKLFEESVGQLHQHLVKLCNAHFDKRYFSFFEGSEVQKKYNI